MKCTHENSIDAGDEEHTVEFCTDCGERLDEFSTLQDEWSVQHQASEFDHEAEKLSKERFQTDAFSNPFNDDPKFKSQYE